MKHTIQVGKESEQAAKFTFILLLNSPQKLRQYIITIEI
jgi:hypothetical protein